MYVFLCSIKVLWTNFFTIFRLEEFQPEIGKLERLRFFQFSHNEIKNLPDEMKDLKSLEEIDFSHNHVEVFDSLSGVFKIYYYRK